jgi:4-alpha-glucanotransferase
MVTAKENNITEYALCVTDYALRSFFPGDDREIKRFKRRKNAFNAFNKQKFKWLYYIAEVTTLNGKEHFKAINDEVKMSKKKKVDKTRKRIEKNLEGEGNEIIKAQLLALYDSFPPEAFDE